MTFKGLKTDLISEVKILWWQVVNKANSVIFKAGNGKADTACSVVKIVKTNQKLANVKVAWPSKKSVMQALWKTFPTGSATWPQVGNSNMDALTTAVKAICLDGILRLSGSGRLTDGSLCFLSNTELFGAKPLVILDVFCNSMMKVLQSRLC